MAFSQLFHILCAIINIMNGMKILVVEDEAKIAEIVKAYLEKERFRVTVADTGGKGTVNIK